MLAVLCLLCCPAAVVPGQSHGSLLLFPASAGEVHVVLLGGIEFGVCSSRNVLGAEEMADLEKDPSIILILAGEGLSVLVV